MSARGPRRTRVYDCNYNLGERYYKSALDNLDKKYNKYVFIIKICKHFKVSFLIMYILFTFTHCLAENQPKKCCCHGQKLMWMTFWTKTYSWPDGGPNVPLPTTHFSIRAVPKCNKNSHKKQHTLRRTLMKR